MGDLHDLAQRARDQEAADKADAALWRALCEAMDEGRAGVVVYDLPEHPAGLILNSAEDVADSLETLQQ